MASDTPPDDERNSAEDPWADLVADASGDDGVGAFDFATLDAGSRDETSDAGAEALESPAEDPFAGLAAASSADPFAALEDAVQAVSDENPFGVVTEDAVASSDENEDEDAGEVVPSHGSFTGALPEERAPSADDEALDGDLFAELVGGDGPIDHGSARHEDGEAVSRGPFDVFEGRDEPEAGEGDAADDDGTAAGTETPALSVFSPASGMEEDSAAAADAGDDPFDFGSAAAPFDDASDEAGVAAAAGGDPEASAALADAAWGSLDESAAGSNDEASPWDQIGEASGKEAVRDEIGEEDAAAGFFSASAVEPAVGAAAVALGAGGAAAARPAPRPAAPKKKGGGLGQVLGIVLGGAASIPIVIALLIGLMWLGWPDTIGMRRWLPGASFILPRPRQVARKTEPSPRAQNGGGLESLPGLAGLEPGPSEPNQGGTGERQKAFDASADGAPVDAPQDAVADKEMGDDPLGGTAPGEKSPAPNEDGDAPAAADLAAAIPAVDPLAVTPSAPMPPGLADLLNTAPVAVPPPPPEPEPLDVASLDAAIEEAVQMAGLLTEIGSDDPQRKRQMVAWYRSLTRVAEELAMLEAVAVDSGRPFEEASVRLDPLVPTLQPDSPLVSDLTRLARNWLSFARRDSDGVVLPVTFDSTRAVGPYWCSKVLIEEADGQSREVAVVSRQAPVAELGERCLVTGVIFDGGTVWAADVRSVDRPGEGPLGLTRAVDTIEAAPVGLPGADAPAGPAPSAIPVPDLSDAPESPKSEPAAKAPALEVPEIDPAEPAPKLEVPEIDPSPATPAPAEEPAAPADEPASDAKPQPDAPDAEEQPAPPSDAPPADF